MKIAMLVVVMIAGVSIAVMEAPVQTAVAGTAFLAGGVLLSLTAPFWRRSWKKIMAVGCHDGYHPAGT